MSSSGQREAVFPTRMTLGLTKTRLKGAQNGHSLLKRKADALTKRFRVITSKIQEAKKQMGKVLQYAAFSMIQVNYATGDIGYAVLENVRHATFKVRARQENVSGVFLPSFTPDIASQDGGDARAADGADSKEGQSGAASGTATPAAPAELSLTGLSRGGQQVQKSRELYTKALNTIVELASLQVRIAAQVALTADCIRYSRRSHPSHEPPRECHRACHHSALGEHDCGAFRIRGTR